MTARLLPGTRLRVRRGRRRDLPQVEAVLGPERSARLGRVYRRLIADLGSDVYVAEDAAGDIVGIVAVVYARSLVRGLSAMLDGVRTRERSSELVQELVAFAEERARRRGCRRLTAWVDADVELRAALLARGYRAGETLVADLADTA
jgi:hypothetical protein